MAQNSAKKQYDYVTPLNIEDVAENSVITHNGPIEISGHIGKNSRITSLSGGILVQGNIASGCILKAISPSHLSNKAQLSFADLAIKLKDERLTITPDQVKSPADLSPVITICQPANIAPIAGISIEGTVDDNVTLFTTDSISCKQTIGDKLLAISYGAFQAMRVGSDCKLHMGQDGRLLLAGANLKIRSGSDIELESAGPNSELIARGELNISRHLDQDSIAISGQTLSIERTGSSCLCQSEKNAIVNRLGFKSRLIAKGKIDIDLTEPGSKILSEQDVTLKTPNQQAYIWVGNKRPQIKGTILPKPRGWRARRAAATPFSL